MARARVSGFKSSSLPVVVFVFGMWPTGQPVASCDSQQLSVVIRRSGLISSSLPMDGFVFGCLVNGQLVSLLPVGILNKFLLLFGGPGSYPPPSQWMDLRSVVWYVANWSASCQLGFFTSFCSTVFTMPLFVYLVSSIRTALL